MCGVMGLMCFASLAFVVIDFMLTIFPLKFIAAHIGSNYLCTNIGMSSLSLSKRKPFF